MNTEHLSLSELIVVIVVILEVIIVLAALGTVLFLRRRAIGREQRYDAARRELSELMQDLDGDAGSSARGKALMVVQRLGVDSGRRLLTELAEFVTLEQASSLAKIFVDAGFAAASATGARRAPWERNRCIREARALGDPANVLTILVQDKLSDVRLAAFEALCALGRSPEGMVALPGIAADGRLSRTRAIDALATAEPVPVETLAALSRSESADLRLVAVGALARAGAAEAVEVIVDAVTDDNIEVRIEALRGLGELDDPVSLPAVLRALRDDIWQVRSAAVGTAAKLGGEGAAQAIAVLLDDTAEWVRHNAALALTRCGAAGAAALRAAAARGNDNASAALAEHRLVTEGA